MQQTSKYQFKLIEGTDDFSPTPLNDNMEKVEEELSELNDTVATLMETVDGHKMAVGSYQGNDGTQTINVGFTPAVVLVFNQFCSANTSYHSAMVLPGCPAHIGGNTVIMQLTDNGFTVVHNNNGSMNYDIYTYCYIAIQ